MKKYNKPIVISKNSGMETGFIPAAIVAIGGPAFSMALGTLIGGASAAAITAMTKSDLRFQGLQLKPVLN